MSLIVPPETLLAPRPFPDRDPLPGLPDRAAFLARLELAAATDVPLAVLFLDLDNFKLINDGFGHDTGDALLCQVAHRLREAARPRDLVARLGGDEFTVLAEGVRTQGQALAIAERLRAALAPPFSIAGQRRQVRVSIGCRVGGAHGADAEALVRDADTAMYGAKGHGKDRVELFSESTRRRIVRRLRLEQELAAALETDGLDVHYQPQVDLASGRTVGVEALVRWTRSPLGAVSPAEFMPVAEETGLVAPLGAHVLGTACRDLASWHAAGLRPLTLTVNVSVRQLEDPGFPAMVACALADSGVEPSSVCLELTESALMKAGGGALDALEAVRRLGIYVAIDDFGTGHSSLARLRQLPVEVLKVDRSFVDGLGTEPEDSAVVASVLSLAHAMGLHVVAEGVETPLQADQLMALGCTVAQGFLFSRAVPADRVPALARSVRGRPRPRAHRGAQSLIDEMIQHIGIPLEAA